MKIKWFLFLLLGLAVFAAAAVAVLAFSFDTPPRTYWISMADINNDGLADAYLANGKNESGVEDTVWINGGHGSAGSWIQQDLRIETDFAAFADLDGDRDLDAVVDNYTARNDGQGRFSYAHVSSELDDMGSYTTFPALGDLDGDGDADLVLGGCCGGVQMFDSDRKVLHPPTIAVLLNDGRGGFTDTGQRLGSYGTTGVALGDLDGDGDLDLYAATSASMRDPEVEGEGMNVALPDMVWINDGTGKFSDSGQRIGREMSYAVALGDVDGDGDLDAFVARGNGIIVWMNGGKADFSRRDPPLVTLEMRSAALADLDGDGDLDGYTTGRVFGVLDSGRKGYGRIWINLGGRQGGTPGYFKHGPEIRYPWSAASALADLEGDGDVDIYAAQLGEWFRVWWNDGSGTLAEQWE